MQYAKRIRDIREDNDLNQTQIAELLKTTQQQYGRYESGQRKLPIDHLITLCRFYNISADYLLGLTDTPRKLK
jgi:transcriptional regulator with XRE-family HTH domain